jgi:hypothetical protein
MVRFATDAAGAAVGEASGRIKPFIVSTKHPFRTPLFSPSFPYPADGGATARRDSVCALKWIVFLWGHHA